MKTCSQCGAQLNDDSRYCGICGFDSFTVQPPTTQTSYSQTIGKKRLSKVWIIVAVLVVLIMLGVGAAILINSNSTLSEQEQLAAVYDWWDGDWYGWWIIHNGTGEYEDLSNNYWDAYATIHAYQDGTGKIILWDEDYPSYEPLAVCEVKFAEGWGDYGCMISTGGDFSGYELGPHDWIVDPANGPVSQFGDMLMIEGTYVNDSNDSFDYRFFLRAWGADWSDVLHASNADLPYEDMMPVYYDTWYRPLIEAGVKDVPDSFEDGADFIGAK